MTWLKVCLILAVLAFGMSIGWYLGKLYERRRWVEAIRKWGIDVILFGNGYLELTRNRNGGTIGINHVPATNIRKVGSDRMPDLDLDKLRKKLKECE